MDEPWKSRFVAEVREALKPLEEAGVRDLTVTVGENTRDQSRYPYRIQIGWRHPTDDSRRFGEFTDTALPSDELVLVVARRCLRRAICEGLIDPPDDIRGYCDNDGVFRTWAEAEAQGLCRLRRPA